MRAKASNQGPIGVRCPKCRNSMDNTRCTDTAFIRCCADCKTFFQTQYPEHDWSVGHTHVFIGHYLGCDVYVNNDEEIVAKWETGLHSKPINRLMVEIQDNLTVSVNGRLLPIHQAIFDPEYPKWERAMMLALAGSHHRKSACKWF
jgi:hypothetical protein